VLADRLEIGAERIRNAARVVVWLVAGIERPSRSVGSIARKGKIEAAPLHAIKVGGACVVNVAPGLLTQRGELRVIEGSKLAHERGILLALGARPVHRRAAECRMDSHAGLVIGKREAGPAAAPFLCRRSHGCCSKDSGHDGFCGFAGRRKCGHERVGKLLLGREDGGAGLLKLVAHMAGGEELRWGAVGVEGVLDERKDGSIRC
jgi:hypothetical protein